MQLLIKYLVPSFRGIKLRTHSIIVDHPQEIYNALQLDHLIQFEPRVNFIKNYLQFCSETECLKLYVDFKSFNIILI